MKWSTWTSPWEQQGQLLQRMDRRQVVARVGLLLVQLAVLQAPLSHLLLHPTAHQQQALPLQQWAVAAAAAALTWGPST